MLIPGQVRPSTYLEAFFGFFNFKGSQAVSRSLRAFPQSSTMASLTWPGNRRITIHSHVLLDSCIWEYWQNQWNKSWQFNLSIGFSRITVEAHLRTFHSSLKCCAAILPAEWMVFLDVVGSSSVSSLQLRHCFFHIILHRVCVAIAPCMTGAWLRGSTELVVWHGI